jgi:hypothetical protein
MKNYSPNKFYLQIMYFLNSYYSASFTLFTINEYYMKEGLQKYINLLNDKSIKMKMKMKMKINHHY